MKRRNHLIRITASVLAVMLAVMACSAVFPGAVRTVYAGTKGIITGLKQVDATEDSVTVRWDPVDDVSYQLIYSSDRNNMPEFPWNEWFNPLDADNPEYKLTGLTCGETYYVQMRTVDTEIVNGYFEFTYGDPSAIIAVKPVKTIEPVLKLSKSSFTYDGKVKKPGVTVKDGDTVLKPSDYTVKYASGRKNVGSYDVTVTMKGGYAGSARTSFTIVPKGTDITKLTAGKKAFTVKWKKQAVQTTGYEIQYSLKKNFKTGCKTVTVSNKKTTAKKIGKLKAKKTYYVRVRTLKKVKGQKYYSAWSKVKKVKVK